MAAVMNPMIDKERIEFYKNKEVCQLIATISIKLDKHAKHDNYWKTNPSLELYYAQYTHELTGQMHKVSVLVNNSGWVQGSFEIEDLVQPLHTKCMWIRIQDEPNARIKNKAHNYQGKGLSYLLLYGMVYANTHLDIPKITDTQKLFIDADMSAGFWDSIGMVENPTYDNRDIEGAGYEKVCTFNDLKDYVALKMNKIQEILNYQPITGYRRKTHNQPVHTVSRRSMMTLRRNTKSQIQHHTIKKSTHKGSRKGGSRRRTYKRKST